VLKVETPRHKLLKRDSEERAFRRALCFVVDAKLYEARQLSSRNKDMQDLRSGRLGQG